MRNHWKLLIFIPFLLSGCMARHVVVLPEEAEGRGDREWRILQAPSVTAEQLDIVDENKDF